MDYFESKKLREERGKLVHEMHELARSLKAEDGGQRTFTPEETQRYDQLDQAQTELQRKIESAERVEKVSTLLDDSKDIQRSSKLELPRYGNHKITQRDREMAFRAWAFHQAGKPQYINDDMRRSLSLVGTDINRGEVGFYRNQTVGVDAEGGHTTSDSLLVGIEKQLKAFGGMREASKFLGTSHGNDLHWACIDDTANQSAYRAELATVGNTDAVFTRKTIKSYVHGSGIYPVSVELIQDSETNISDLLSDLLGERIARKENAAFSLGTGVNEPEGLETVVTAGKVAAATNAITYGELVDLQHSVNRAYRANAIWMFNDNIAAALRKMVDGNGLPIWQPSMQVGQPDVLLGKRYITNDDLADFAVDAKTVYFGDFQKGILRQVGNVVVQVLRERFAEDLEVAFIAHARSDWKLINTTAIKALAMAAA